eukprot:gene20264-14820_t
MESPRRDVETPSEGVEPRGSRQAVAPHQLLEGGVAERAALETAAERAVGDSTYI